MKLSPVHPVLWSCLLTLWFPQSETQGQSLGLCEDDENWAFRVQNSMGQESSEEITDLKEKFICLLYPTNELNCSWSFHTLEEDYQLSVYISVCEENKTVTSLHKDSVERVGSMSFTLTEDLTLAVILHFNKSLHNSWMSYTYLYDMEKLEFLSPPPNISVSVKDKDLFIAWDCPITREPVNPECFEYQLDISDQEQPKHLVGVQSYRMNADPMRVYSVRMRTRISQKHCSGSSEWSDWSQTLKSSEEPSAFTLNPLMVASISLGIPMILLAVLLFVRYQRITKVLFPPIPHPPLKYKQFLERSDAFNFFYPAPSKPEEEITEVEDTEQNLGKAGKPDGRV